MPIMRGLRVEMYRSTIYEPIRCRYDSSNLHCYTDILPIRYRLGLNMSIKLIKFVVIHIQTTNHSQLYDFHIL